MAGVDVQSDDSPPVLVTLGALSPTVSVLPQARHAAIQKCLRVTYMACDRCAAWRWRTSASMVTGYWAAMVITASAEVRRLDFGVTCLTSPVCATCCCSVASTGHHGAARAMAYVDYTTDGTIAANVVAAQRKAVDDTHAADLRIFVATTLLFERARGMSRGQWMRTVTGERMGPSSGWLR